MAMNATILGIELKNVFKAHADSLGQSSDPANSESYMEGLWIDFAAAVINHFHTYAEIASLTVSNTPADGAAHTHAPASTSAATGKIS